MAATITWNVVISRQFVQQSRLHLLKAFQFTNKITSRNFQWNSLSRCVSQGHLPIPTMTIQPSSIRYYSDKSSTEKVEVEFTDEEDDLYKWIEVRVKGHDEAVLNSYEVFVSMAAKELDVTLDSITKPNRVMKRLSLLKSPFIHKKHFVQYEMRTHYRVMLFKHLTGSTASIFLEYIQRNLPEGVAMKVTKCAHERMPEYIKPPSDADIDQLVTGKDNVKV